MTMSAWLQEAAALPVAFAQVREDPLIDEALATLAGPGARICMIASGGCTAAALAAQPGIALIHCVDPNPAQLALAQIKLALLRQSSMSERLLALGHAPYGQRPCTPTERAAAITRTLDHAGQQAAQIAPRELLDALGFDHIGRYERLFAALRAKLAPVAADIEALLQLADVSEQRSRIAAHGPLWPVIENAFLDVMALPHLVALFGEGATRNPLEDFPRHFLRRLRWAIESLPALTNPFLAQLLFGRFIAGHEHRWIALPPPARVPKVEWEHAFMVPALRRQPGNFDIVHLSNILDWLSPDEARETLDAARTALRPDGYVIVRQLNSSLNIPALGAGIVWDEPLGARFLRQDRSFFYREVLVGRAR